MSFTEDETMPRCSICALRDIKDAFWDRAVEDKKRILLAYIHQHGILAPMMPEHFHRIRMMKLDLVEAQIQRGWHFDETDLLDEVENYEEMVENFRSWARFMKTVGTNKDPYFNRMMIGSINQEIESTEFTLSVCKGALDGMIALGYEPLRSRQTFGSGCPECGMSIVA
ncbi:MAG: hypothetical protein CXT66_06610 [Methanobacteriota archaeon]|jgi:hypothetical protein|nr:MAG: hypothetical protein CXT66_06610 [Euryarchaeota archaeon]